MADFVILERLKSVFLLLHVPFDPIASALAAKSQMKLVVMKGSDLDNLRRFLEGKEFKGTVVG